MGKTTLLDVAFEFRCRVKAKCFNISDMGKNNDGILKLRLSPR